MSYRNVFSQMFDVRPRSQAGDLDLEKIKRIEAILNLRPGQVLLASERIINLRPGLEKLNVGPVKINIAEFSRQLKEERLDKIEQLDFWPEDEEEISPSQSEILSVFDIIEATDQILKKPYELEVVNLAKKEKRDNLNINEPIQIIEEDDEESGAYGVIIKSIGDSIEGLIPIKIIDAGEPAEASSIVEPIIIAAEQIKKSKEPLTWETKEEPVFIEMPIQEPVLVPLHPENLFLQAEDEWKVKKENFLNNLPFKADVTGFIESLENQPASQLEPFEESFWLQPNDFDEVKITAGNQFLTPEFLLGKHAASSSFSRKHKRKAMAVFLVAAFLIFSFIPLVGWLNKFLMLKTTVSNYGLEAYQSLILAKDSLSQLNFKEAGKNFAQAHEHFAAADVQISKIGGWFIPLLERLPGFSFLSSGTRLVKVGQDMSKAGEDFAQMINLFEQGKINFSPGNQNQAPFSDTLKQAKDYLQAGLASLISAKQSLEGIKISSLPQEIQPPLILLEEKMPQITQTAAVALDWSDKFLEIMGEQSAKKYLLIFQNNAEIRATGGFIGTYGLLDLDQGQIKKLFIDGIYNLDGQLKEKIIPPKPLQKIAIPWTTHDANWFADFPASAQKIMWFFEKTGGPTVDGVISLTPTVIEKLLELTGPIEIPEYGVMLDDKNFAEVTQYKVEIDYDKELNQPKKILADFAPKFIDRINDEFKKNNFEVFKIVNQALKEKHILFYFSEPDLEQFVKTQGWGGEILEAKKDYLAVVNSNIDGRKTDRVIEENIKYSSEIETDGSVIDTLTISRHHQGGNSKYDWFNAVNVDYLRVYLPKGSQLISVSGQTKEEIKPLADYAQSGYRTDEDLANQEKSLIKDESSGTEIFEESGKTVFGNWVYVKPGETAVLTYKYRLPFKINTEKESGKFDLLAQKQPGSFGSSFEAEIKFPESWQAESWHPDYLKIEPGLVKLKTDLSVDRVLDLTFKPTR